MAELKGGDVEETTREQQTDFRLLSRLQRLSKTRTEYRDGCINMSTVLPVMAYILYQG